MRSLGSVQPDRVYKFDITRTVGNNGDFKSLHDGLTWLANARCVDNTWLTLELLPGTHYLGIIEKDVQSRRMYHFNPGAGKVIIKGSTQNMANHIITHHPDDPYTGYPFVFTQHGGQMEISDITYDPTAGGAAIVAGTPSFYLGTGGRLSISYSEIKDTYYGLYPSDGAIINPYELVIDNSVTAIIAQNYGKVQGQNITINDADYGFDALSSGFIDVSAVTLNNVSTESATPKGEIHYSGGLYTDGETPLTFKV